jgi:hypothetical protein
MPKKFLNNISRDYRLLFHGVLLGVSLIALMATAFAAEFQVRWIDIDDKGNFSVAFFENGKRVDRKVRDRFQFFISNGISPRNIRDLKSVGEIEELEQTWTTFKGIYKPAAYSQEYPLISGTPYDAAVVRDSCYFIVCPRPAVLRGHDNELSETCTPPALFRWFNYDQTVGNIAGNFFRRAKVYLKNHEGGITIPGVEIELEAQEVNGLGPFDLISDYIRLIINPKVVNDKKLVDLLKESRKMESHSLVLEDGSLETFKLFFPPDSMGLPRPASFKIVSTTDPASAINEVITIDPNIPRQQFNLLNGKISAEILVAR